MGASFDVGDTVTVWHAFLDDAGEPWAPDAVVLTVRDPLTLESHVGEHEAPGSGDDLEAWLAAAGAFLGTDLSSATGTYRATISPTRPGVWWYAWHGIGVDDRGDERTSRTERFFDVRRRRVPEASS